jgi:hypothetical protein
LFDPDASCETTEEQKIGVFLSRQDVAVKTIVEADGDHMRPLAKGGRQRGVKAEVLPVDAIKAPAIEPDLADAIEASRAEIPGSVCFNLGDMELAAIGAESSIALASELIGVVEVPAVGELDRISGGATAGEPPVVDLPADKLPIVEEINSRS